MTTLAVCRGLPGSGKSYAAHVNYVSAWGYHRVSRDDLRRQLFGKTGSDTTAKEERRVGERQQELVRMLLRSGYNVVVDDTNLPNRAARTWLTLAIEEGATVEWVDLRNVSLAVCLERNALRIHPVPEEWIRDRWQRYCRNPQPNPTEPIEAPVPAPPELYVPDRSLPQAYLFDIDGTLALNTGYRSPYDTAMAGYDDVNIAVRDVAYSLYTVGYDIVITTGRHERYRELTDTWLRGVAKVNFHSDIYMRPDDDDRNDSVVKREMLDKIGVQWYVRGVFDDRQRVVDAWRSAGLVCFQVAEGKF